MKPELSIIIPCYNCEKTLKEAVDSCFTQDLSSFEIVMVDDGSTDNTRQIMQELAKAHKEINLFYHDKNKGGGATRNTAVAHAGAEIIFCLDSDDMLPPHTLSKMLIFLKGKNCDGVTFHKSVKFNGNDVTNINYTDTSGYLNEKIPLTALLNKKLFCPIYVNFMYTKDAFNKMGGYPTNHGYDTQGFAWRFMCKGLSAYTCPDTTYLHRTNFNASYFVREYDAGKINYNWRDILIENDFIFTKKALDLILTFDCSDFTRELFSELIEIDDILIPEYQTTLGKIHPKLDIVFPKPRLVQKNSLQGIFLRIRRRIINKFKF